MLPRLKKNAPSIPAAQAESFTGRFGEKLWFIRET